jgi:hypothetical protein
MAGRDADGDQVCVADDVIVEGKQAVWIFLGACAFYVSKARPGA